jgi:hypothetical protein
MSCGAELFCDLDPEVAKQYREVLYCTVCGGDELSNKEDIVDEELEEEELEDKLPKEEEEDEEEAVEETNAKVDSILAAPLTDSSQIRMDLWELPEDMTRNVIISGVPVAQIHLSKQKNPENISGIFKEDVFEDMLVKAMLENPIGDVLKGVNALFLGDFEQPAEDEIDTEVEKRVLAFVDDFKKSLVVVLRGSNKNIFPEVHDTLKESLWQALAAEGIENPTEIIEKTFVHGPQFFEQILDKTFDIMEKGKEAQDEISNMVEKLDPLPIEESISEATAMSTRLVKGSFPLSITTPRQLSANKKNEIRSKVSFRKN